MYEDGVPLTLSAMLSIGSHVKLTPEGCRRLGDKSIGAVVFTPDCFIISDGSHKDELPD